MRKRYSRKPHRIKKRKLIFKYRLFWLVILVLVIGGGIFYLICFSLWFQIKEIKISGNEKVPTQDIQEIIQPHIERKILFSSTKSIFLTNLKTISNTLLTEFPQIAEVNLERNFPNVLIVIIEERKPVAVFYHKNQRFFIDKQGMIFKEVDETFISPSLIEPLRSKGEDKGGNGVLSASANARVFEEGGEKRYLEIKSLIWEGELKLKTRVIEKELLAKILEIKKEIGKLDVLIIEALIVSDERLNVKTLESWEIYFDLRNDISNQLFNLEVILDEKIPTEKRKNLEYIDLRFGDRIFFYKD